MQDLFFYTSKVLWLLFAPDNLYLLLLSAGILLLFTRFRGFAKKLLLSLMVVSWIIALLPVGEWLFYPLETRFPSPPKLPESVDGIIVLGGSINPSLSEYWQQLETYSSHERLSEFILLAKKYPKACLVFTGGNASMRSGLATEAGQVRQYLLDSGIEENRLILENSARNTYENALLSKQLVQPAAQENWILVTSAYHLPRAVGIFCQQGWPVIPYPVDHSSLPDQLFSPKLQLASHALDLVEASHEWVGLIAYYLTDKTSQLIPTGCGE